VVTGEVAAARFRKFLDAFDWVEASVAVDLLMVPSRRCRCVREGFYEDIAYSEAGRLSVPVETVTLITLSAPALTGITTGTSSSRSSPFLTTQLPLPPPRTNSPFLCTSHLCIHGQHFRFVKSASFSRRDSLQPWQQPSPH
jgi:hypothetical protein